MQALSCPFGFGEVLWAGGIGLWSIGRDSRLVVESMAAARWRLRRMESGEEEFTNSRSIGRGPRSIF
jgi:hypothetical protein